MKRYVVFGFEDYTGTSLEYCIQGTSDTLAEGRELAGRGIGNQVIYPDTIQILDTHSGSILTWTGSKWAKDGNAES